MALEQKLSLRLAQRLVMTPSLQQAIKLLQMTRIELQTVVTEELVENPVLEESDEVVEESAPESEQPEKEAETEVSEESDHEDSIADIDLEAYFNEYMDSPFSPETFERREAPPLENTLSHEPDLYDHLLWQLHMMDINGDLRTLAELVIGNLDPDGFLVASLEEIAASTSAGNGSAGTLEDVERAVTLVQSLDPPGVGCSTLQESLLAQLRSQGHGEDSLASQIVEHHWEPFLKRHFVPVARELGVDLADIEPVVETIRHLETRPGRKYGAERTHYVEPDVYIIKVGDEYVVQLNDDGLPRLRISGAYRKMLSKMKEDRTQSEARQFIKDKMRSALWLIKSLDQRQRTIYKVSTSIVEQQQQFLERGIDHLRPMVLRDVADDIGMHESTVSRVVSNKYMHTPRGLFPMKYFFHSGIDRDYGDDISSLTVKRKIEQLIRAEEPKKPLSDSALTRALNREGINIARRTVAKYRDELGVPSSTDRKQIF